MSLPQCQIVVYPYGNESITARMLNGAIDDTRDTNIITRAAVKALQDLDPWLVSPLEDASVELQVRFREGARICPERFTVIETVPAGFPDRCGIAVGQNSSICHDFHQTGYRALPTVFRRLTPGKFHNEVVAISPSIP